MIKKIKKEQLFIGALVGILLLVIAMPVPKVSGEEDIPEKKMEEPVSKTLEEELEGILQSISGVGKVKVLITYRDYGKRLVEKDESVSEELIEEADSSGGKRTTTTVQKEHQTIYQESEQPFVVQELSPSVEGILVVAQGAGNASVKNQIKETIEALFGLDEHKISIMKMEVSK